MAALTLAAAVNKSRTVTITASTDDGIGSSVACLVVDNTAAVGTVDAAIDALIRGWRRRRSKVNAIADIATSGTSTE